MPSSWVTLPKFPFLPLLAEPAALSTVLVTVSSHNCLYFWMLLLERLSQLHRYGSLIPVKNDHISHLCVNCVMIPKADISTSAIFSLLGPIFFLVQSYLIHQQHLATSKVTCGSSFTVGLGHKIKKAVSYREVLQECEQPESNYTLGMPPGYQLTVEKVTLFESEKFRDTQVFC